MTKEEYIQYLLRLIKAIGKAIDACAEEKMEPCDVLGFIRLQHEVYRELYQLTN